jgi:hypothetical protein
MPTWNEGPITKHTPDDTDEEFYLREESGLSEIIEASQLKWPGIALDEINIRSEYIHTDCITYDLYDPSDWTKYLCISADRSYFERITRPKAV